MVKSFALISVVVATGLGFVNGAPIKFTRDAAPVVQREQPPSESINRRFPQALAADTPGLAARNPEEVTRRFPRRVHYEYYMKREVDPHRRHYTADEPSVIAREPSLVTREPSPEEIAREALNARNVKRSSRRSTAASEKDLYKRTLKLEGVKTRSPKDEPAHKRAITEMVERAQYEEFKAKREPTPAPEPLQKLDSRALDKLEVRDSPVRESRAFVPRAPASHYPASEAKRDNYVWNIHNGDETIVEVDLEMIAACVGGASPCSSTGTKGGKTGKGKGGKGKGGKTTTTGTSTATDTSTVTGTSTATGTVTDTPTSTTTSSSSTATLTGTNAGDAPPGGAQVPPHGGANGTPHSDTTSTATSTTATTTETGSPSTGDKKKKPVDTTVKPPPVSDNSPHTGGTRRDEKMDELLARTPSAKWRRIIPAASLKRSVKSAPPIQFAR